MNPSLGYSNFDTQQNQQQPSLHGQGIFNQQAPQQNQQQQTQQQAQVQMRQGQDMQNQGPVQQLDPADLMYYNRSNNYESNYVATSTDQVQYMIPAMSENQPNAQAQANYPSPIFSSFQVDSLLAHNKMAILEAYEYLNNDDINKMVQNLGVIHDNLTGLAAKADQSMVHAEQTGQSSNALYVLREEQELISQEDMIDYITNYPHCHYSSVSEEAAGKDEAEEKEDTKADGEANASASAATAGKKTSAGQNGPSSSSISMQYGYGAQSPYQLQYRQPYHASEQRQNMNILQRNEKRKQVRHMWTDKEHQIFEQALHQYGAKQLKEIAKQVGTRTVSQVRSHLQKYLIKVKKNEQNRQQQYDNPNISTKFVDIGSTATNVMPLPNQQIQVPRSKEIQPEDQPENKEHSEESFGMLKAAQGIPGILKNNQSREQKEKT